MKILVAPDKFKGCLTAPDAAALIAHSLRTARPDLEIEICPIADGGDGTLEVLSAPLRLEEVRVRAQNPLGRSIDASFGLSRERRFAVVEMARASGLALLAPGERDALNSSTFGTGQLVLEAIHAGAREVLVTLGGSATVDGGLGFLQALGATIRTSSPIPASAAGGHLSLVQSLDPSPALRRLQGIRITGLYDVALPLLGPQGARLFMPQKGATPAQVGKLDADLDAFAGILSSACGRDLRSFPGTGAAGGLGMAILALGGDLGSGFDQVALLLGLAEKVRDGDLVVTGEGFLDEGSRGGKAPVGMARLALAAGKPCYAVCGAAAPNLPWLAEEGFTKILTLFKEPLASGDARLAETQKRMGEAVTRLAQQLKIQDPK